ncbi:MAG TPA: hypothetical protein PKH94_06470 [Bacteroidales bacterium]|nr:hypothetical protein [Bacteroidales bacterium]HNS46863.1 hypothetical protein [Bacteroidales bacterium]
MQSAKKTALLLILFLLFIPFVQNQLHIFPIRPLNGDFILPEKPALQKSGWLSGDFQAKYNPYLEQCLGLHNSLVRLHNQIDFTLFKKVHAEGVVIGRHNVLHEQDYIRAWTGEDFIGSTTWDKKLGRLKFVQDHLKKTYGIDLVPVLEPSKARFSPETLPEGPAERKKEPSNYTYIVKKLNELNIRFLDLNACYLALKDTSRYDLYPRYGVHWSVYGMTLMADTMVKYIERMRQIDMPDFSVERIIVSDSLRDTDYDAAKPLNLLFELPHGPMAYPVIRFEDRKGKTRPDVLVEGDSYYWNIYNARIPDHCFNNHAFWYFNALVYPDSYDDSTFTADLDIRAEVEKKDVILIMSTERFLFKYDWGFTDALFEAYTPDLEPDPHYSYENNIRENVQFFDELVVRAQQQNKTLEKIIHQEADYMFKKNDLTGYLKRKGTDYHRSVIAADTAWMRTIEQQAADSGLTVEETLNRHAGFMFWKQYPDLYSRWGSIKNIQKEIENDSSMLARVMEGYSGYCLPREEVLYQEACRQYRISQGQQEMALEIERIIQTIRNDPAWMEAIAQKAAKQNRTTEEMLRLDAMWMLERQKK